MNSSLDELFNAALALPDNDRAELVEALISSFHPQDRPPFDESWRDVIARRSAELQTGQVKPIAWDEVKRSAREKAGG
jgi:putative addiction module component (TIGR02574 family)